MCKEANVGAEEDAWSRSPKQRIAFRHGHFGLSNVSRCQEVWAPLHSIHLRADENGPDAKKTVFFFMHQQHALRLSLQVGENVLEEVLRKYPQAVKNQPLMCNWPSRKT